MQRYTFFLDLTIPYPAEALRAPLGGQRESRELSPLYCVETNGFVRLYTNRLLTHQSLGTLSDDHLALKELRFTPFGARGFCDTN